MSLWLLTDIREREYENVLLNDWKIYLKSQGDFKKTLWVKTMFA